MDADRTSQSIFEGNHSFSDVYSFLSDRFRSVVQDLNVCDDKVNRDGIRTLEEICRFYIVSFHDGSTLQDIYHEINQRLGDGLSQLLKTYEDVKRLRMWEQISDEEAEHCLCNQIEFSAYHLIQT